MQKPYTGRFLAVVATCLALLAPAIPASALDRTDAQPPQLVAFDLTPFQADINRVASAGLTAGRPDGRYDAAGAVSRDQMGSFLARSLDLYVASGLGLIG